MVTLFVMSLLSNLDQYPLFGLVSIIRSGCLVLVPPVRSMSVLVLHQMLIVVIASSALPCLSDISHAQVVVTTWYEHTRFSFFSWTRQLHKYRQNDLTSCHSMVLVRLPPLSRHATFYCLRMVLCAARPYKPLRTSAELFVIIFHPIVVSAKHGFQHYIALPASR